MLTGKVNPSGKLSETFPLSYEDTPAYNGNSDSKITVYGEGLNTGYRYYDTFGVPVLFPFGFGLSYSQFGYKDIKLKQNGKTVEVGFKIENLSDIDGKEVSQIYIRALSSCVYRPFKELKGFAKTFIKAGQTASVTVKLDERAFEYWSVANDGWRTEEGVYEIIVAASAADVKLKAKLEIGGKK